jgi:hypothetical protein
MIKRHQVVTGLISLVIGIVGTAYAMGADRQNIENLLAAHDAKIIALERQQKTHKSDVNAELDRFSNIVAGQISQLQASITGLTAILGDVGGDVKVLKALVERIEGDIKNKPDAD